MNVFTFIIFCIEIHISKHFAEKFVKANSVYPHQMPHSAASKLGLHCLCMSPNQARGYKTFSIINSTEHGISNAHKLKYIKKFSFFLVQISLECYFFLLINVKMPATVGILTIMSRKNFMLN